MPIPLCKEAVSSQLVLNLSPTHNCWSITIGCHMSRVIHGYSELAELVGVVSD